MNAKESRQMQEASTLRVGADPIKRALSPDRASDSIGHEDDRASKKQKNGDRSCAQSMTNDAKTSKEGGAQETMQRGIDKFMAEARSELTKVVSGMQKDHATNMEQSLRSAKNSMVQLQENIKNDMSSHLAKYSSVITAIQSIQEDLTELKREFKGTRVNGKLINPVTTTAAPEKGKSDAKTSIAFEEIIDPVATTTPPEEGRGDTKMPIALEEVIDPVATNAAPEEERRDPEMPKILGKVIDPVATTATPGKRRKDPEMSIALEEVIDPVATTAAPESETRETTSLGEPESKDGESILITILTFWDFPDESKAEVEEGPFWLLDADGVIVSTTQIDPNFLLGVRKTFQDAPGGTGNIRVGHCISEKAEVKLETNAHHHEFMFAACPGCVTNGNICIVRVPFGFVVMLDSPTEEERHAFRSGVTYAGQFPGGRATHSTNILNSDPSSGELSEYASSISSW